MARVPYIWHRWHSQPGNFLLWVPVLCIAGCLSSIPGLSPLDASVTLHIPPGWGNQKCLQTLPNVSCRAKSSLAENYWSSLKEIWSISHDIKEYKSGTLISVKGLDSKVRDTSLGMRVGFILERVEIIYGITSLCHAQRKGKVPWNANRLASC